MLSELLIKDGFKQDEDIPRWFRKNGVEVQLKDELFLSGDYITISCKKSKNKEIEYTFWNVSNEADAIKLIKKAFKELGRNYGMVKRNNQRNNKCRIN